MFSKALPQNLGFPRLKSAQLLELQQILRSRTTPSGLQQRSELIWLRAGSASLAEASEWVGNVLRPWAFRARGSA